jgi:hypothetical protein
LGNWGVQGHAWGASRGESSLRGVSIEGELDWKKVGWESLWMFGWKKKENGFEWKNNFDRNILKEK